MSKQKSKKVVLAKYGFIVTGLLVFAALIIFSASKIVFTSEGKKWREVGEKETVIRDRVILPKRGNIYTYDGKLLATTEPLYSIYMDFWADGMRKDTLVKYVDDLSKALAHRFPDRSAAQYKNVIMNGWSLREKEERQIQVGKEPSGTVPHALFLIVGDTLEAATAYHKFMPPESVRSMLVDTFKDEVEESLRLASDPRTGLESVRLDTPSERGGVTPGLVKELRAKLDLAGYEEIKIFVSGGLDPERIRLLADAGADAFGVGSYISGASAIDMTMDLKTVNGQAVAKRGRIPGLTPAPRLERIL